MNHILNRILDKIFPKRQKNRELLKEWGELIEYKKHKTLWNLNKPTILDNLSYSIYLKVTDENNSLNQAEFKTERKFASPLVEECYSKAIILLRNQKIEKIKRKHEN